MLEGLDEGFPLLRILRNGDAAEQFEEITEAADRGRVLVGDDVGAFAREVTLDEPGVRDLGVVAIEERGLAPEGTKVLLAFHGDTELEFADNP